MSSSSSTTLTTAAARDVVFHVGDANIDFKCSILDDDDDPFDLTTQNEIVCEFLRPDKTTSTQTGQLDGAATLGKVKYAHSGASILDQDGRWGYRFKITLIGGSIGKTLYRYFKVNA